MLKAVSQVDTPCERLIGLDTSKTGLRLIFRKHALQLNLLFGEVVDERRSAPLITKLYSRADIDQVISWQLPVRTGELRRQRREPATHCR